MADPLVCPFEGCGDDYVHIAGAPIEYGGDDYLSPFGNRGESIVLKLYCESGHWWLMAFNFHKGQTYLHVETRPELVKALTYEARRELLHVIGA